MAVVFVATFMVLLDVTIVMVAIPSLQRNLHATYAQVQLVVALYLVAYAVCLVSGGRLGDLLGRKRMFMTGVAAFVVASALCGVAPNPELLLGARVLQGMAAALMYPQALSYAQVLFSPAERNRVFAVFGAVIGVAALSGQLLGGALIQWNGFGLDWRLIFLVNIPVGAAALVAAALLLVESRDPASTRLDFGGLALISVALLLLVWPLVEGREAGWPLWAQVSLGLSLPAFAAFALYEARLAGSGRTPLVDLRLFRRASFSVGLLTVLALLAGIPSFVLTFSLYVQGGLGFGALRSGVTVAPFMATFLAGSILSTRLVRRFGVNALVAGAALMTVGMALTLLSIDGAGIGLRGVELIPWLALTGLGAGTVVAQIFRVVVSGVDLHQAGAASGVLATAQQVGAALGIAVVGIVFFGYLRAHADAVATGAAPALAQRLEAQRLPAARIPEVEQQFRVCFDARAAASDPTITPSACPSPGRASPVSVVLSDAGGRALATNMHDSIVLALLFNVVTWTVAVMLLIGLALIHRSRRAAGVAAPAPPQGLRSSERSLGPSQGRLPQAVSRPVSTEGH
jgi:EmrB/QacA subfamily drug resistance transporter